MPSDAEPFLQRIRAFPDDDAQRLIYADWLEEQGDPRGPFLRDFLRALPTATPETLPEGEELPQAKTYARVTDFEFVCD